MVVATWTAGFGIIVVTALIGIAALVLSAVSSGRFFAASMSKAATRTSVTASCIGLYAIWLAWPALGAPSSRTSLRVAGTPPMLMSFAALLSKGTGPRGRCSALITRGPMGWTAA